MVANDIELEVTGSRTLPQWLRERNVGLAFTTYQAGKLFMIGTNPEGRLSIFERTFARAMGMCVADDTIWMSSLYQLWRFENALVPGQAHDGYDKLYVPRVSYTTGDLDIHDVAVDGDGQPVFISTALSCLATVSDTYSVKPLWKPSFISKVAPEDRCHLNGLAMRDGKPRYVTAVSQSDVGDGWRDHRHDGGIVIDIESNEIIATGLSMPHSPRWHNERLWLHNSGTGEFGFIDVDSGSSEFVPLVFCPGYLRGLTFVGNFAIVGLSGPREDGTYQGLALEEALASRSAAPRCGLQIIDLSTGNVVEWLRISGIVNELYDVAVLANTTRPMALGFKTSEIQHLISLGDDLSSS